VKVDKLEERITICVRDNGSIQEKTESNDGVGLVGLSERIESLGGAFQTGINTPNGFFVFASFPSKE
jgi:glucose-6-phosphate-specific signal transduction histidine kinase